MEVWGGERLWGCARREELCSRRVPSYLHRHLFLDELRRVAGLGERHAEPPHLLRLRGAIASELGHLLLELFDAGAEALHDLVDLRLERRVLLGACGGWWEVR